MIAIYNDWDALQNCLRSLTLQKSAPVFEVILVDDGSTIPGPRPDVEHPLRFPFPVSVIRQRHFGVSSARNTGIFAASGEVIVFVDCDSFLHEDCLRNLSITVGTHIEDKCFQLNVSGETSTLVGRIEHLHLATIQNHKRLPDGHIRYLNTTGAAIRKSAIPPSTAVFDPQLVRGEDTQLLTDLIRYGELPRFVDEAIVHHGVKLSLTNYLWKTVKNGYFAAIVYCRIRQNGIAVRATAPERIRMLRTAWQNARIQRLGVSAFLFLVVRQGLGLLSISVFNSLQALAYRRLAGRTVNHAD